MSIIANRELMTVTKKDNGRVWSLDIPSFCQKITPMQIGYDKIYVNGLLLAERKTNRSYKTNVLSFDSANTTNTGGFELHSIDVYYE